MPDSVSASATPASLHASPAPRTARLALACILCIAGAFRLPALDRVPPGLHQDEAANAWNAWCLLKTGRDQAGAPWPIFYLRAMGENRSALFVYLLIPFQALGGMNLWTTRLPGALAGVATVALLYWTGARLFGRGTGLAAAALLALNPVHIQLSRMGHEATITPLLSLLPFAALLWAGFPLRDTNDVPRPGRALLAGLVIGLCCYGYPAVRLFVPVFLTVCVVVTWRGWWHACRTRRGLVAIGALAVGVAVTFGPLAWQHITEPDKIGLRGQMTWIWKPEHAPAARAWLVAHRYCAHFHPHFLFQAGDADEMIWTVGLGFVPWYVLPLALVGLVGAVFSLRRSPTARLMLVGVLLFPIGDAVSWHVSLHSLRSSAGLVYLLLPAAAGVSAALATLAARRFTASRIVLSIALIGMTVPETVRFARAYYHERALKLAVFKGVHVDLVAACRWLRPRVDEIDAFICTPWGANQPYLITAVMLEHDPARWHAEPIEVEHRPLYWDWYGRYGKFYFPDNLDRLLARIAEFRDNGRPDRVILFLRHADPQPCPPTAVIPGPGGTPALVICDCTL